VSARPIIITGCPRSGTLLAARVVGSAPGLFLISEHSKKSVIPEEHSGVVDSQLWWNGFEFEYWDSERARPSVETPIHDSRRINRLRDVYTAMAGDRRLVIKNPSHLARLDILAEMFPVAAYLFCLRGPWHTIQSMAVKAVTKGSFLLRTEKNLALPNDPLLKAAASWVEAIEIFEAARTDDWTVSRYEDLVANPTGEIERLYAALDLEGGTAVARAARLPQARTNNYHAVKTMFRQSSHRDRIMDMLGPACETSGYSLDIEALPSSPADYHLGRMRKLFGRFL
jgi:hypothetical protein